MNALRDRLRRRISRKYTLLGVISILMLVLLIAAACGEEATPTPQPGATSTPVPATATPLPPGVTPPTATPLPPGVTPPPATATPIPATATPLPPGVTPPPATATPVPATATPVPAATATPPPTTGLRARSEWTVENPATLEEMEAELEKHRGESFVWVSWGGAYQAAQRQAFVIPFQDQFGIEVIEESQPEIAKIRTQAETGVITQHVLDSGFGDVPAMIATDSLEELDFSVIDDRDFLEVIRTPYTGGGGITWSTLWAYNTESYPEGNQPTTMADIYDTDKFPGRRAWAYYHNPEIRFVLLGENPDLLNTAEGRATLSSLTDAQVDRAFELMYELGDQVTLIWQTGSDCPQLLISGELDMCTAWNGRIFDAVQEGAPLKMCWECGHLLSTDVWFMPNGLKELEPDTYELANLFIGWASFPEINARISRYISYGPVNLKSIAALGEPEFDAVRDHLPSSGANIPYAIIEDEWWSGETYDALNERYMEWQQQL